MGDNVIGYWVDEKGIIVGRYYKGVEVAPLHAGQRVMNCNSCAPSYRMHCDMKVCKKYLAVEQLIIEEEIGHLSSNAIKYLKERIRSEDAMSREKQEFSYIADKLRDIQASSERAAKELVNLSKEFPKNRIETHVEIKGATPLQDVFRLMPTPSPKIFSEINLKNLKRDFKAGAYVTLYSIPTDTTLRQIGALMKDIGADEWVAGSLGLLESHLTFGDRSFIIIRDHSDLLTRLLNFRNTSICTIKTKPNILVLSDSERFQKISMKGY